MQMLIHSRHMTPDTTAGQVGSLRVLRRRVGTAAAEQPLAGLAAQGAPCVWFSNFFCFYVFPSIYVTI